MCSTASIPPLCLSALSSPSPTGTATLLRLSLCPLLSSYTCQPRHKLTRKKQLFQSTTGSGGVGSDGDGGDGGGGSIGGGGGGGEGGGKVVMKVVVKVVEKVVPEVCASSVRATTPHRTSMREATARHKRR